MAANQLRKKKNDPRVVTYQIDRNINYTNFCTEYCSFCAFYRPMGAKEGYVLSNEAIFQKIEEMLELGGTGILLQGGLHPDLQMSTTKICCARSSSASRRCICTAFPRRKFYASPKSPGCPCATPSRACGTPGLDSIPGGGAEILDDEIRARISRLKCTAAGMGGHAPHRALARHAHHRHHDVRLRRRISPPRQSPRAPAPHSGRHRRLHRVHPVDVRAGKYAARQDASRRPPPSNT